jgi:hypothetical protein
MHIAEAGCGDLDRGGIGGIIRRWWKMDDEGLEKTMLPFSGFYRISDQLSSCPILKFCSDGNRAILGERFSSTMMCRKRAIVKRTEEGVHLAEIEIIWVSSQKISEQGKK